jgi:CRP-like cAMP-binding protein
MSQASFAYNSRNQLLSALAIADYEQIAPELELVSLSAGQVLFEANQPIQYAYFPLTAVISLLNPLGSVIVTTIGNEGMVGIALLLGTDQMPMRAVTQVAGEALRLSATAFQSKVTWDRAVSRILLRYTQTLMNQVSQDFTCTKFHSHVERCCYLLALLCDRVDSLELPLTSRQVAHLIGIRQSAIAIVIATLEQANLIQGSENTIQVVDPPALRASACSCYLILRSEFDQVQREL